jgi:hypothetical protein
METTFNIAVAPVPGSWLQHPGVTLQRWRGINSPQRLPICNFNSVARRIIMWQFLVRRCGVGGGGEESMLISNNYCMAT